MANVLIVDDDPNIREYLDITLRQGGHQVKEASDVTEALSMCHAEKPELIITDVLMPENDGFEFVRRLRADRRFMDISVIFFTASYNESAAKELAEACGVSAVIPKPARPETILRAVDAALLAPVFPKENAIPHGFDREHLRVVNDKLYKSVRELEASNDQLRASESQLHRMAERLRSAQEEERKRIARNLHDDLGQALTLLKTNCNWIASRLSNAPAEIIERLQLAVNVADQTIVIVRRLATELRPGILDFGITAAIEWQAEEFQSRTGVACIADLCDADELVNANVATEMFRILQETLTNILRHAEARVVNISLVRDGNELVLVVHDDGKGISDEQLQHTNSLGVLGMRERAALIGGTFSIHGVPGKGTKVRVGVPLSAFSEG